MMEVSALESLYFGKRIAIVTEVPGEAVDATHIEFVAKPKKQQRHLPINFDGVKDTTLVLTDVPSQDIVPNKCRNEFSDVFPQQLRRPLRKSPAGTIKVICSGIRSALIKLDGRWYRLKGMSTHVSPSRRKAPD
jgi:hypothetical protein